MECWYLLLPVKGLTGVTVMYIGVELQVHRYGHHEQATSLLSYLIIKPLWGVPPRSPHTSRALLSCQQKILIFVITLLSCFDEGLYCGLCPFKGAQSCTTEVSGIVGVTRRGGDGAGIAALTHCMMNIEDEAGQHFLAGMELGLPVG